MAVVPQQVIFQNFEKHLLIDLVKKKLNKKTNRVSIKAWDDICKEYNITPGVAQRDRKQLMSLYGKLKQIAWKKYSTFRRNVTKTGGGCSKTFEPGRLVQRILDMNVLSTKFDSDSCLDAPRVRVDMESVQENIDTSHDFEDEVSHSIAGEQSTHNGSQEPDVPLATGINMDRLHFFSKKCKKPPAMNFKAAAASAIVEKHKQKTHAVNEAIIQEREKHAIVKEELELKVEVIKEQLKFQKKLNEILEENPSALSFNITTAVNI